MTEQDHIVECWAQLGAGLTGGSRVPTPDLERLLLDTARIASADPRLVTVAVTWLSRCSSLVAEHRLAALVRCELEAEHKPALGLLLDLANAHSRRHDRRRNLDRAISFCGAAAEPRPFFEVEQRTIALARRAERRASEISRRWNLWMEPTAPKYDALRPSGWIVEHNPDLAFRADLRGDLRASILLILREDPDAGASVSELARRCMASRPSVVGALDDLELGGHLRRRRRGRVRECLLCAA